MYKVIKTDKGFAINNNGSILFKFESGDSFKDQLQAERKCEKIELALLNLKTNPEGIY